MRSWQPPAFIIFVLLLLALSPTPSLQTEEGVIVDGAGFFSLQHGINQGLRR